MTEDEREWLRMRARVAATLWSAFAEAGVTIAEAATMSGVTPEAIDNMLQAREDGGDTRDLFRVCYALGFRLNVDLRAAEQAVELPA